MTEVNRLSAGTRGNRRRAGQAMTEFAVAGGVILTAVFLAFPFLARIGDMRHTAIQMARYEAWEYTVWSETGAGGPNRAYLESGRTLPQQVRTSVRGDADRRFLGDGFDSLGGGVGQGQRELTKRFWIDEAGISLYADADQGRPITGVGECDRDGYFCDSNTPEPTGILGFIFDAVDLVSDAIQSFTPLDPFSKLNGEGYQRAEVLLPIAYPTSPYLMPTDDSGNPAPPDITITAQAGVLSDNWAAAGREDNQTQVRGLVPTALLGSDAFRRVQGIAGTVAFGFGFPLLGENDRGIFEIPSPGSPVQNPFLEFGRVADDAVHPDWVSGDDRRLECGQPNSAKVCRFLPTGFTGAP